MSVSMVECNLIERGTWSIRRLFSLKYPFPMLLMIPKIIGVEWMMKKVGEKRMMREELGGFLLMGWMGIKDPSSERIGSPFLKLWRMK